MFTYERNIDGTYSIYDRDNYFVMRAPDQFAAVRYCRHLEDHDRQAQAEFAEWWRAA